MQQRNLVKCYILIYCLQKYNMKGLRIYYMKGLRISHFLLERESGQSHSPTHLRQYAARDISNISNKYIQHTQIYHDTSNTYIWHMEQIYSKTPKKYSKVANEYVNVLRRQFLQAPSLLSSRVLEIMAIIFLLDSRNL